MVAEGEGAEERVWVVVGVALTVRVGVEECDREYDGDTQHERERLRVVGWLTVGRVALRVQVERVREARVREVEGVGVAVRLTLPERLQVAVLGGVGFALRVGETVSECVTETNELAVCVAVKEPVPEGVGVGVNVLLRERVTLRVGTAVEVQVAVSGALRDCVLAVPVGVCDREPVRVGGVPEGVSERYAERVWVVVRVGVTVLTVSERTLGVRRRLADGVGVQDRGDAVGVGV